MSTSSTASLLTSSELLRASQSAGPAAVAARAAFVEHFGKLLKKITAQTCRRYHLNGQERDEVLAEAYKLLFSPDIVRFAAHRGTPAQYFRGIVQNAAPRR